MRLVARVHALSTTLMPALSPVLLLGTRLYVAWQFLLSGYLKVTSWDQTVGLFTTEYHTPLLPPYAAAVAGSAGELVFSTLLVLGLFGRLGAIGLFAVNAMAVISYRHVLLAEGFEAALGQHLLWGYMLAVLAVYGAGSLSLDALLSGRRASRTARPALA
jgi:putative oxidoreductase